MKNLLFFKKARVAGMQFFIRQKISSVVLLLLGVQIYIQDFLRILDFCFWYLNLFTKTFNKRVPKKTKNLELGYVMMKTNFTQIYDKTRTRTLKLLSNNETKNLFYETDMPKNHDAQETLKGIYSQTYSTPVMKWIHTNAQLEK